MAAFWRLINRWWVWALLYFAAVPGFALRYQSLTQPFYHTTTRFEADVRQMPPALAESLTVDMVRGISVWHPRAIQIGAWNIPVTGVRITGVRSTTDADAPLYMNRPEDLFARCLLTVYAYDSTGMVQAQCQADVLIDVSGPRVPDSTLYFASVRIKTVSPPALSIRESSSHVLRARGAAIARSLADRDSFSSEIVEAVLRASLPGGYRSIVLTDATMNALQDYADATSGLPARLRGSFGRMLYVSAAIITTLGIGDVVPISGQARLWTAVEAIVGVVLIGLFLNSVAGHHGPRLDAASQVEHHAATRTTLGGDAMADDRLMVLGDRLHDAQIRLAYYLMTLNASAVALVFNQMQRSPNVSVVLVLATASWIAAFSFGVRHLMSKNAALLANIQAMKVEEGTHERLPTGESQRVAAFAGLTAAFVEWEAKARSAARSQAQLLVGGAALYGGWLLVSKRIVWW